MLDPEAALVFDSAMTRFIRILVAIVLLSLCAITSSAEDGVLSKSEAEARSQLVSNIHYSLTFRLDQKAAPTGNALVSFQFSPPTVPGQGLRLDFQDPERVSEFKLNGVTVATEVLKGWIQRGAFVIPSGSLRQGRNEIQLSYKPHVSDDGSGLNSFKDGADVYFYTDFQPFYAHRLFPCFDQPDLKATFQLQVEAPDSWIVASVNRESGVQPGSSGKRIWSFPETEKIPTYAFPLFAGPFAVIVANTNAVPLRILVRKSRRSSVPSALIFQWTERAIRWMENYLEMPFPFSKYDQVFIPGYHASGMENAGVTTMNEEFLTHRGTHIEDLRDLMATLFHEVVHAWFGNSVTYKWWNGLWLHEGLANVFSMILMREVGGDLNVRQYFYTYLQSAAEQMDSGVYRRALDSGALNTKIAEDNFDAATYAKAPTMLTQLFAVLGPANVRNLLQVYAHRFKGGAANPSQFFEILGELTQTHFGQWQRQWLKSSGINQIKVQLECDYAGQSPKRELVVKSLVIEQAASPKQGPLRHHSLRVGLMNWSSGGKTFGVENDFLVHISRARTPVWAAVGKKCPSAVDPNLDGIAYVRELLDDKSSTALLLAVGKISDRLHRQRVWKMLWHRTKSGLLDVVSYMNAITKSLPLETDFYVLKTMLDSAFSADLSQPTAIRMLPLDVRMDHWRELERALKASVNDPSLPRSSAAVLVDSLVEVALSKDTLSQLSNALSLSNVFAGVWLTPSLRWKSLGNLGRHGRSGLDLLAKSTLAKDISDEALVRWSIFQSTTFAQTRRADIWRATSEPDFESRDELLATWKVFHWLGYEEQNRPYGYAFFRSLRKWIKEDQDLLYERVSRLYPSGCEPDFIAIHEAMLKSGLKVPGIAGRVFATKLAESKVCLAQRLHRIPGTEPGLKPKRDLVL